MFQRILVFQTAFLGDAILSIPLLKSLRKKFPEAKLALVCRRGIGALFLNGHLVDEVIEVDKVSNESLAQAFAATKTFNPDLIMSAHRSFRTALWVRRLSPKMSVGYRDWWSFFAYKRRVGRNPALHDVLRQMQLMAGVEVGEKSGPIPKDETALRIEVGDTSKFDDLSRFVAIAPGSQWNTKMWTTEGYVDVAKRLHDLGWGIILLGSAQEHDLCQTIADRIPGGLNLAGKTSIVELAQVLKRADLLICNDSGTMHVATAVGIPVVAIFGPTVPAQGYAPWTKRARIIETGLGCRPCGAHGHDRCPIGTHECMTSVTSEMVFAAAKEFLP